MRQLLNIVLGLILLAMGVLSSCAEIEPTAYRPISEVPDGPGLFTGEKGAVVFTPHPNK